MAALPDELAAGPLTLLRWRVDAAEDLTEAIAASFIELHAWMPWAAALPEVEAMRTVLEAGDASFEAGREWPYLLYETGSGALVGSSGLHRRAGPQVLEIGYWVRTDRTRRGYATAAARALTDAAFASDLGIESVEIHMDRDNGASAAVARGLGFELRGKHEREILTPSQSGWGYIYAVDRGTWTSKTRSAI